MNKTQPELEAKMKADLKSYFHLTSHLDRFDILHQGAEFGVRWALDNLIDKQLKDENNAQDQAIINVDRMPNIHRQIPEKAYIFGFIDGDKWAKKQTASL